MNFNHREKNVQKKKMVNYMDGGVSSKNDYDGVVESASTVG